MRGGEKCRGDEILVVINVVSEYIDEGEGFECQWFFNVR